MPPSRRFILLPEAPRMFSHGFPPTTDTIADLARQVAIIVETVGQLYKLALTCLGIAHQSDRLIGDFLSKGGRGPAAGLIREISVLRPNTASLPRWCSLRWEKCQSHTGDPDKRSSSYSSAHRLHRNIGAPPAAERHIRIPGGGRMLQLYRSALLRRVMVQSLLFQALRYGLSCRGYIQPKSYQN
jgi:hypothetical protein